VLPATKTNAKDRRIGLWARTALHEQASDQTHHSEVCMVGLGFGAVEHHRRRAKSVRPSNEGLQPDERIAMSDVACTFMVKN
jgi:hypothetical protein